jgi:hypothetical protein
MSDVLSPCTLLAGLALLVPGVFAFQDPASSGLPSLERANSLTLAELVQRRDLWPARVKLLKDARLDATTWFRAGEELPLYSFDGSSVGLDQGTFLFEWPAASTDVIERTRALAASLSSEALALTFEGLRGRGELWPLRVKIQIAQRFSDNAVVPAGREVSVRFFEGSDLAVYDRTLANYYTLEPQHTDLMAQARARLALPAEKREPFFLRSLAAALEPGDAATAERLAGADFVLVYSGRLNCPRCAQFVPQLRDFAARAAAQPTPAKFELLYLSSDPTAEAARAHRAEAKLPGAAIAFERRLEAANLMAIPQQLLPGLFAFDRQGALIDRNHPAGGSPSASEVLARFEAKLKQAPPAR